ncbi:MAG: YdiU family protein [Myxococcota bacterium]
MAAPSFESTYAALPERFHARIAPTPVAAPRLLRLNTALAAALGLDPDWLASPEGVAMLAGNAVPASVRPLAMAYAGHQFGNFVPQLGDGRAILLGERPDAEGRLYDVQLKGAGPTPFSRSGDGRAAIGPVLREYVVSEAMAALGIPTTRALAAVATGEDVYRETPLPGAILTRVARGHLRVGTFEFFASRGDQEAVETLVDYAIERLHPEAAGADRPALALFESVVRAHAVLVPQWLGVGFIHGVMNTDNTTISGETIDYGPCAFLDAYHPGQVFSSIDHAGRYAYGRQPGIAAWNLARFAETLLPLLGEGQAAQIAAAQRVLDGFEPAFQTHWREVLRAKLGLVEMDEAGLALATGLLDAMAEQHADFTRTFRALGRVVEASPDEDRAIARDTGFEDPEAFARWAGDWRARLAQEGREAGDVRAALDATNPARIPRNHRIEAAIEAAREGDLAPFERLVESSASPFEDDPRFEDLTRAPTRDEAVRQTFCGT